MTHMTRQDSAAASHARNVVDKTAGSWTRGTGTMMDLLPPMPQVDLVLAVESYFNLVQRTVELNRRFAVRWAEAAVTLSGVVRETAGSAGDVVRERTDAAGNVAREQPEQAEKQLARQGRQAELEEAEQAERAVRKQAEQAVGEQRAGTSDPPGRARAGQPGSPGGPRAPRKLDQGRAERPAGQAGSARDGQRQ